MRSVVVYESMFGSTHAIAEAVATGLRRTGEVVIVPVEQAVHDVLAGADLVVVGGPTHAHGMSSSQTRKGAPDYVEKSHGDLTLEPGWDGMGLRDWFKELPATECAAAAFDTRADMSALLSGRASKGIADRLKRHGCHLVADPESFLVGKDSHLLPHELDRAAEWGASLAAAFVTH
jgi:hypothetical protein